MIMKEIVVLKPIKVPDCIWCMKLGEGEGEEYYCRWFECGNCLQGFCPKYDKNTGNWLKPKECRFLKWEENIN